MAILDEIKSCIRDVPDFPKPGILFRDFTPLIENPKCFRATIDLLAQRYRGKGIERVVSVESRGFIIGAPLAVALEAGCIVVRKKGKLPFKTDRVTYDLEYGTDTLEMHQGVLRKNQKVLLIDDVLATGGTMGAVRKLVQGQGGHIVECAFIIELRFLKGRDKLDGLAVHSLIQY